MTGRVRPRADPALVADLRTHLESGLEPLGGAPAGPGTPPLLVTKGGLSRVLACGDHASCSRPDADGYSVPLACGALVEVLFRQLVTTGSIGDAFAEGLDGLAVDGHRAPLVGWIGDLSAGERCELAAEVERQATGLAARWPSLDPTWLPRTQERMRVTLGAGHVELFARVDLVVGRPGGPEASVALVDVTSGMHRAAHAVDRRFQALVETLRTGVPPFAVASYHARSGELDVDPVSTELLVAAARRCRAGIDALVATGAGHPVVGSGPSWCSACADGLPGAGAPDRMSDSGRPVVVVAPEPFPLAGARPAARLDDAAGVAPTFAGEQAA